MGLKVIIDQTPTYSFALLNQTRICRDATPGLMESLFVHPPAFGMVLLFVSRCNGRPKNPPARRITFFF